MQLRTTSRFETLTSFGLSETCAKVYLALVDQPSMSATALANAAKVPRSHLYNVIQELQNHGLAEILVEENRRSYRAKPIDAYLASREDELRREVEETQRARRTIAPTMEPPPLDAGADAEAGALRLVLGRRAVAKEIEDLLLGAKREVVIAGSSHAWPRLARHVRDWRATEGSRDVRVVAYYAEGASEWIRPDPDPLPGVEKRALRRPQPVIVVAVDAERILIVHPAADTSEDRSGRDFGILTTSAPIARSYVELLDAAAPRA